jgi:hypothetical protein
MDVAYLALGSVDSRVRWDTNTNKGISSTKAEDIHPIARLYFSPRESANFRFMHSCPFLKITVPE